MQPHELVETFNRSASGYDTQTERMSPIYNALHFLLDSVFSDLPDKSRVLCVGVGTGAELVHLALKFPDWSFTAVDPSSAMLELCRAKVEKIGFVDRCEFHEGYVDSLAIDAKYDAATSILVSQFILKKEERSAFFHSIAQRLKPGGILANCDLSSDTTSNEYEELLKDWCNMMSGAGVTPENLEQMRENYKKHVSILPSLKVAAIMESSGFERPIQFFQAGLISAWYSKRISNSKAL